MNSPIRDVRSELVVLGAIVGDGRAPSSLDLSRSAFTGERADLWDHLEQRERDRLPWDAVSIYRTDDIRPELRDVATEATTESGLADLHVEQHRNYLRRLGWRRDVARAAHRIAKAFEAEESFDADLDTIARLAEERP